MRAHALRAALAAAIIGPAAAVLPTSAVAAPGCAVDAAPAAEASITAMTNATRGSRGLVKLRRDDFIGDAARSWSARMGRTGAFEHSTLSWRRGRNAGENIAQAPSAGSAYQGLLDSPPHRENILERAWRFVGIGAVRCDGTLFVTMNLMAPPGIRPQPR
jgi:uncharacterized protein YkwD